MSTRKFFVTVLGLGVLLLASASVCEAAPTVTGSFSTPTKRGNFTYTALRAFRGGSEGNFVVAGRTYPGSAYAAVGGGVGFVWYYGVSGITAGNALVKLQPDGTYSGPIWFFNRNGSQTDAGTLTVK